MWKKPCISLSPLYFKLGRSPIALREMNYRFLSPALDELVEVAEFDEGRGKA